MIKADSRSALFPVVTLLPLIETLMLSLEL